MVPCSCFDAPVPRLNVTQDAPLQVHPAAAQATQQGGWSRRLTCQTVLLLLLLLLLLLCLHIQARTLVQEAYKFQLPRPPQLQISSTLQHSILAHPLSICSIGNASQILRACQMQRFFNSSGGSSSSSGSVVTPAAAEMSPATALFTQLRSYPRNAGEVEGAKRVLQGVLGRIADAVHQVLKRLAAMKVGTLSAARGGKRARRCGRVCWDMLSLQGVQS
jgi:hypothetical protein